jgi:hypothetical protein
VACPAAVGRCPPLSGAPQCVSLWATLDVRNKPKNESIPGEVTYMADLIEFFAKAEKRRLVRLEQMEVKTRFGIFSTLSGS